MMSDIILDIEQKRNEELVINEPIKELDENAEYFYCEFCGVTTVEECKCNDTFNQYNGDEYYD